MKKPSDLVNLFYRLLYRMAYLALKLSWMICPRNTNGAQVMLWVNGELLLVRTSYRNEFTFPGGYINVNETPVSAARRELAEEVNIEITESNLRFEKIIEYHEYGRFVTDVFFTCKLNKYPQISIDNREIVEAIFVEPDNALMLSLHYSAKYIIEVVTSCK